MQTELSTGDLSLHGGANRSRTDDLILARDAFSQLNYSPISAVLRANRKPELYAFIIHFLFVFAIDKLNKVYIENLYAFSTH